MEKIEYTKGPWCIDGTTKKGHVVISADTWHHLATVIINIADNEWRYNAHLISAAPELLEALLEYRKAQRDMLKKWADGDDNVKQGLWKSLHACEAAASAAIEKATDGKII